MLPASDLETKEGRTNRKTMAAWEQNLVKKAAIIVLPMSLIPGFLWVYSIYRLASERAECIFWNLKILSCNNTRPMYKYNQNFELYFGLNDITQFAWVVVKHVVTYWQGQYKWLYWAIYFFRGWQTWLGAICQAAPVGREFRVEKINRLIPFFSGVDKK